MNIIDYLEFHIVEILTAFGVGGGGGLLGKKILEKKACDEIKEIKIRLDGLDRTALLLEKNIELNTEFDKQLRKDLDGKLARIEGQNERIITYLLNMK